MKPSIDDVALAFHVFQQTMMQALTRHSPMSGSQRAAASLARADLMNRLQELGLSEHIDWTEPVP